jgi:hypothetical protein
MPQLRRRFDGAAGTHPFRRRYRRRGRAEGAGAGVDAGVSG